MNKTSASDLTRLARQKFDSLPKDQQTFVLQFPSIMDERYLATKKCELLALLKASGEKIVVEELARSVSVSRTTIYSWLKSFIEDDIRKFLNSSKLVVLWDEGDAPKPSEPLTFSELEIITSLVSGKVPKQIALERRCAVSTIYNRIRSIREKTGYHDIAAWATKIEKKESGSILDFVKRSD